MATATLIEFPTLDSFEVSTQCGSSQNVLELVSGSDGTLFQAWFGATNTFGVNEYDVSGSAIMLGSWLGSSQTQGALEVLDSFGNSSPITSGNPDSNENLASVEWNYFPFPPTAEGEVVNEFENVTERDVTRFKKAYSFSRQQPVRIRLFRT